MKKPEIFEILITDDRNFSDDNFSKGFNRQVLIVAKNEKRACAPFYIPSISIRNTSLLLGPT